MPETFQKIRDQQKKQRRKFLLIIIIVSSLFVVGMFLSNPWHQKLMSGDYGMTEDIERPVTETLK